MIQGRSRAAKRRRRARGEEVQRGRPSSREDGPVRRRKDPGTRPSSAPHRALDGESVRGDPRWETAAAGAGPEPQRTETQES